MLQNQSFCVSPTCVISLPCRGSIWLALILTCGVATGYDDRIDDIMYQDPAFPELTTRIEFPENLKRLWMQALERPESELQRMTADTIAMAQRCGMQGLDAFVDKLLAVLHQEELAPSVRRAVANALVTLDARRAAEPLAEQATRSLEIARIVEPALAGWGYEPAKSIWRQRVDDLEDDRSRLQLAMQCLGIIKDEEALTALVRIVRDVNIEVPLRVAAARAASEIFHVDLLAVANDLATATQGQPTESLLATTLLTGRSGSRAVPVLKRLAVIESATVRGLALRRLFEIEPSQVYEFAESAIGSGDVNIRRVGCETLFHKGDNESVVLLAPLLDDANPGLRRYVSEALLQLATRDALRDAVIQSTAEVVSRDGWRGLEQGIIVLATLDYEPLAPRLVDLLDHRRPEVTVTAAWGLRKLAVLDTLPAMLAHAQRQVQTVAENSFHPRYGNAIDRQLSQLFQAFGELGYVEAEALMRKFIPKTLLYSGQTRPAAVWAIGKLHEGKHDEPLSKLFAARLADVTSMMPELGWVRRMSAIGIGRMNSEPQLATLRQFVAEAPGSPGLACAWAIERMTGEVHEFTYERVIGSSDWFLVPASR